MAPKKISALQISQNEKTRNINLKNLNLNVFLTKTFDENSSISCLKTNCSIKALKVFDFYTFLLKISFLVSCCHFCSFFSTEDLTGLPKILSSNWLNYRTCCFTSCCCLSHQVGEEECGNEHFFTFCYFFLKIKPKKTLFQTLFYPYYVFVNKSQPVKRAPNSNNGQNGQTSI